MSKKPYPAMMARPGKQPVAVMVQPMHTRDHRAIARKAAATRKANAQAALLAELETVQKLTRDKRLACDFPDVTAKAQERLEEIKIELANRSDMPTNATFAIPIDAIAEHDQPAKPVKQSKGELYREFAALGFEMRVAAVMDTAGIEFCIVGPEPPELFPAEQLPAVLGEIAKQHAERAERFFQEFITMSREIAF